MIKKSIISKLDKLKSLDSLYYYVLVAAVIAFAYVALCSYGYHVYQFFFALPCIMLYGALLERKAVWRCRKNLLLPLMMVLWFIFLNLVHGGGYNLGLFAAVYLFAFPLAALLQDGDKKIALKIFAGAYFGAAAVLTVAALMLLLNIVPAFLSDTIYWNGSRLYVLWNPNIAACIWMIGTVFCTTFLSRTKSRWLKAGLCMLIILMLTAMALTNSRTGIILTGGFLGATIFFAAVKRGRKWFVPGVLAAVVIVFVFFTGAGRLYQANYDLLLARHTQQSVQANDSATETKDSSAAASDQKKDQPVITNAQGTLQSDFGSLNGRTHIWSSGFKAIRDNPTILLWGVKEPGAYVSAYTSFGVWHMHNAWMECLMGMGLVGLLIAMLFTLATAWNSLIVLLKHYQDIWKRNVALLALCLMAASVLEPYLFYTAIDYHPFNLLFFLCAGYLVCWQEEDNRHMLAVIRSRLPFGKE